MFTSSYMSVVSNEELRVQSVQLAIDYLKGMSQEDDRLLELSGRIYKFIREEDASDDGEDAETDSPQDDFPF